MKSVEILGPWLKNKGDELMYRSILDRLQPHYNLGVTSDLNMDGQKDLTELPRMTFQPNFDDLQEVFQKRSFRKFISVAKRGIILPLLPQRLLSKKGLLNARNLVALFDCSGFAYGDHWPPNRMIKRTSYYEWLRKREIKLIMLPQALGPFNDPNIKPHARRLFDQFDMIFPREKVSEQHVLDLGIETNKVEVCPDISHLLQASHPPKPINWGQRVTIVPNARMIDKTNSDVAVNYLDFLVICVERVRANKLEPVILLHETNDDKLINQLQNRFNTPLEVVDEDGITSKAILGSCYANIGSRYHSLVSSFSQGTPSIGTSWAHKYEILFEEYGCEDYLLSPTLTSSDIAQKIDEFLSLKLNKQLRDQLERRAAEQKLKVETMWQRVESMISSH